MDKSVSFFNHPPPSHHIPPNMAYVNNVLAAQNDAIYRRHCNFTNLPLQQLRHASREDAILRDELRETRRRLTMMERRIEEFENQVHPNKTRQHSNLKRGYESALHESSVQNMRPQHPLSQVPTDKPEPDLSSWLIQQRQNCELWNQNFALKECLRNIELENSVLREMCRQKEINISLLEKKTRELRSDLSFYSDLRHDTKEVTQAFNFKPLKKEEAKSYKCTCGQC
ncbi:unnamed protein product [Cylicocyclus nassatus]|uniref:Uncharacterized protein n=1 Tax=Cylicocyclus nassatus TaxID=53992 RepID=A0AA36DTL7_CYLNA|nr:unnamed protein product [Cylicocyclus nassatus]